MRRFALLRLWLVAILPLLVVACSGDDTVHREPNDASVADVDAPLQDASSSTASDASDASDGEVPGTDAGEDSAAGDSAPPAESGGDDAGEAGFVPAHCVDLSGTYQANDDDMTLTRPSCGSLTWARAAGYDGTPAWVHVYTTDGVTRAVTDEQGNAILEEAHVDDTAMYVHRVDVASNVGTNLTVLKSLAPCNLLDPSAVYLTRETANASEVQTACDFWAYDGCPQGTQECDLDPTTTCETNIASDPANCGGCNAVCGDANTSAVQCSNETCLLTCLPGFANCGGGTDLGCNVDITTTANCGYCNASCGSEGTTSSSCVNEACVLVCDATHADCDDNPADGCEMDTTTAGNDCGGCGNDCGAPCAPARIARGRALRSRRRRRPNWEAAR